MSDSSQQTSLFEVTGKTVIIWADATCRKQHCPDATDGYGCVIKDGDSGEKEEIQGEIEYEDHYTAPVAKYKAIINGIKCLCDEYSEVGVVQIYNDAEVPVEQIDGSSDTNESHLQNLKEKAHRLLSDFDEWHIDWQEKSQSRELQRADELAEDATRGGTQ
jgi:ribonuclease HI